MDPKRLVGFALPPLLLIIVLLLPTPEGLSWDAKAMFGVLIFAGTLFILQPIPLGLSGGLAFMFLISTPGNLTSYSSGYFTQKDLFKVGFGANLLTILLVILFAYTYWKWIGVR